MRAVHALLAMITLLGCTAWTTVSAQPGGAGMGATQCVVGNVTQGNPAANGDIIVTFEVTRELLGEEKAFVGETNQCEHITVFGGQEIPPTTTLVVTRGAGGTPTPGGGPVKVSYTVTAKQGWDLKFRAEMKYKDKNNTEQTIGTTKKHKVT